MNKKVVINGKERTVRFNTKKMCFECNVGYKDNQFKPQSRIIRGESLSDLEQNVINFEKGLQRNLITVQHTTFAAFAGFYFENIATTKNAEPSIRQKKGVFNRIPASIKNTSLANLTALQLQSFYADCYKRFANNTVYGYYELINAILNCAVEYGAIKENPNRLCSVRPLQNGKKIYWSVDTCKQFLKFLQDNSKYQDLYRPVLLVMASGCRRGEVAGVKYDNVDYTNCVVKIAGQMKIERNKSIYSEALKTNSSKRTLKIPREIFTQIFGEKPPDNTEFAFLHKGKPWHIATFSYVLKAAFTDFGRPEMSIKHLRSSFVRTQIEHNAPLKAIQVMLGHSKLSTTADIYGELTCEDTFQYADNMLAIVN